MFYVVVEWNLGIGLWLCIEELFGVEFVWVFIYFGVVVDCDDVDYDLCVSFYMVIVDG